MLTHIDCSRAPKPKPAQRQRAETAGPLLCGIGLIWMPAMRASTSDDTCCEVLVCVRRGHEVVCFVCPRAGVGGGLAPNEYSIVRPTSFFKSLSGQVDRLRRGKPFLVFGDGRTGHRTLAEHHADLANGRATAERGDHAVFCSTLCIAKISVSPSSKRA